MCNFGCTTLFQATLFLYLLSVANVECQKNYSIPLFSAADEFYVVQFLSGYQFALVDVNNDPSILPNIVLSFDTPPREPVPISNVAKAAEAIMAMIDYNDQNKTFIIGNDVEDIALAGAQAAKVYGIAQLSCIITLAKTTDQREFPYFSKIVHNSGAQIQGIQRTLRHFKQQSKAKGWDQVAILAATTSYAIELSELFFASAGDEFDVLAYQQFLPYSYEFDIELKEIKESGARIILNFYYALEIPAIIKLADSYGLVNDNYVWIGSDDMVAAEIFPLLEDDTKRLLRGFVSLQEYIADFDEGTDDFGERWIAADPNIYPLAGIPPDGYIRLAYDSVFVAAKAIEIIDDQGLLDSNERIPPEVWSTAVSQVEYDGVSGKISFDSNRERDGPMSLYYYAYDTADWRRWAFFDPNTPDEELDIVGDVVWFSGSSDLPDLDIRDSFDYWSCHDKKERTDETGKTISLHTPDGSNVDEISSHYHCDNFIDCQNISDEYVNCPSNYLVVFIVFGIITIVLIFIALIFLVFVLVFGVILRYKRLKIASPSFLVLMLISMIIGYCSVFAWFGKPHPVACAFQPWLLGLPIISMISALCAKNIRIWRIFRTELVRTKIKDLEIFGIWLLAMVHAVLIVLLWTIISTPTAKLQDRDGEDHYVCATGGFTGEPGGFVFFAILVAYGSSILISGAVLSFVIRNVPSSFNESKLLSISIYNLGFLSVVIIPVFLVINPYNSFLAWILRTVSILYAITATMLLQFVPAFIGIVFVDKLQNSAVISVTKTSVSSVQT